MRKNLINVELLNKIAKETDLEFIFYDVKNDVVDPKTGRKVFTEEEIIERYNKYRDMDIDFDSDVCLRSMLIFEKVFPFVHDGEVREINLQDEPRYNRHGYKYEIGSRHNEIIYRGDTMNSVATTLRRYYSIFGKETALPESAIKHIDIYHTVGNFMVIPFKYGISLNGNRGIRASHDYFDLFLLAVYNWYHERDAEWTLEKIFGDKERADFCAKYLALFTKNGKPSWDAYVEKNLFQDWVCLKGNGCFGMPIELWQGHFERSVYPETKEEFENFWINGVDRIIRRGVRIYEVFKEEG